MMARRLTDSASRILCCGAGGLAHDSGAGGSRRSLLPLRSLTKSGRRMGGDLGKSGPPPRSRYLGTEADSIAAVLAGRDYPSSGGSSDLEAAEEGGSGASPAPLAVQMSTRVRAYPCTLLSPP